MRRTSIVGADVAGRSPQAPALDPPRPGRRSCCVARRGASPSCCCTSRATSPTPTSSSAPRPDADPAARARTRPRGEAGATTSRWPVYGYTADRRRALDVPRSLRPPFKRVWTFNGRVLLEFPPVMAGSSLYLLKDNGRVNAINKNTGQGALGADGRARSPRPRPPIRDGRVYLTVLGAPGGKGGRARRACAARDRQGPVVARPAVAHGVLAGRRRRRGLLRLGERDGLRAARVRRRRALDVQGVRARSRAAWRSTTAGCSSATTRAACTRSAPSDGTAGLARRRPRARGSASRPAASTRRPPSPTAACTSATSTATSTRSPRATGELAWRTKTSGYVYASPGRRRRARATSRPSTSAPTTATSTRWTRARARIRWRYGGGSKISGGATLLGDIVYFSDLGHRRTIGLGARTGRKVFEYPRGGYNPVITDGQTLYLVGYGAMYALRPLSDEAAAHDRQAQEGAGAGRARARAGRPRGATRALRARLPRPRARACTPRRPARPLLPPLRRPPPRRRRRGAPAPDRPRRARPQGRAPAVRPALRGPQPA